VDFLGFDHIDCRVSSLAAVEAFYDRLMPELGLTSKREMHVDAEGEWFAASPERPCNTVEYYEAPRQDRARFFMGIIEKPDHVPTHSRIAFRVTHERMLTLEASLKKMGAANVARSNDMEQYPAIFFEDAAGTKLEIVARLPK
jgi:catechol 2,3-dioxygenase-like lactoylglutathione lyase family enzyme